VVDGADLSLLDRHDQQRENGAISTYGWIALNCTEILIVSNWRPPKVYLGGNIAIKDVASGVNFPLNCPQTLLKHFLVELASHRGCVHVQRPTCASWSQFLGVSPSQRWHKTRGLWYNEEAEDHHNLCDTSLWSPRCLSPPITDVVL